VPHRTFTMPYIVGTRLNEADHAKLAILCAHMQRPTSDVLRFLIRVARPVDVAPIRFDPASSEEARCGTE
jgi:hypothetical protein